MYRKIDIHVGPALVEGKLVSRHLCTKCRFGFVKEDVPVGKTYEVDLRSVRWVRWQCGGCGEITETRVIDVWDTRFLSRPAWFPLELLDIAPGIVGPVKPLNWAPVKNNQVDSPHKLPGSRMVV